MNRRGHAKTLVASHPGNRNAVKAGVFSPDVLAPRVQELEAEIASRPAHDAILDLLRRELAALAALGEAMDRSLAKDGIHGRSGEPRALVSLRLRVTERLRRTAADYREVA